MSQINIDVIDVEYADVPKKSGKGTYGQLTVTFKNDEGKVESKKLLDFATPEDAFKRLRLSTKGDTFAVERKKNDAGYWDWIEVSTQTAAPKGVTNVATVPTRSTYETAEERAAKQVFIIRQSSLGHAVAYHTGKDVGLDVILATAKEFENYVHGNPMADLADDIPE